MKGIDKYFDGYVKAEVPKKNGKGVTTEYVYIDDYYKFRMNTKELKNFRMETVIIYAVYTIIYFYASFMDTMASHTAYVGVISLLILIPGLFWYGGLINLLSSGELMESRKYVYGIERIINSTKFMLFLSALQIVGEIIFLIVHHKDVSSFAMEGLFTLLAVIEVAILLFYKKLLEKIDVEKVPNPLAAQNPKMRASMEQAREERLRQEEKAHKARDENKL